MVNPRGSRENRTLAPDDEITDAVTGERYRVRSLIGEGGMGRVFTAEAMGSGAIVAVKCNQPIDPTNEALVERARREGEFLKQLRRHPHIVPVLATGMRDDGVSWMVMPFLDGASVGGLLSVLGRIPLPWALRILQATCSALAEAHRYAIHRDIKPENLFVTRDGGIFVLDFGAGKFYSVGRLTTTGTTLGTVQYSSPEQLTDPDDIDARSDLFSVGVVAFEMLTGEHPFDVAGPLRGNRIIIGNRIIREPPRPFASLAPELPGYMAPVVEKLLEKDRDQRSRNAAEAERVFGAAYNALQAKIGPPPRIERIFDAYDGIQRERELATRDTEKAAADLRRSGPRPKLGTVPMAAYVARSAAPPAVSAPAVAEVAEPSVRQDADEAHTPAPSEPAANVSVAPISAAPASDGGSQHEQLEIQRKLFAMEALLCDDSPETRDVLLLVLRDLDESPVVRAGAAITLGVVGDEACLDALHDWATVDPNPVVRRVAEEAALKLALHLGFAVQPVPLAYPTRRASSSPAEPGALSPASSNGAASREPPAAIEELDSPWAGAELAPPEGDRRPGEWSMRSLAVVAIVSFLVSAAAVWAVAHFVVR